MTQITLANWQSVVATMKSDFELAHKYKIAGKLDLVFEFVAKAADNASNFEALKRTRIDEAIALHRIAVSSDDADTKQKKTGQAKIAFIQKSVRALQAVAQKGDAQAIAKAINSLSSELSVAVTAYKAGMATVQDAVKDANFLSTAGKLADDLKSLLRTEAPRLAKANILYSVDSVKAGKTLDAIKAALLAAASLPPPSSSVTSSDSSGSGSGSGSGTDITV
ncbi:MAG: hypothetical protein ACAH83_17900 [Alphaproteobacteria bacterium]